VIDQLRGQPFQRASRIAHCRIGAPTARFVIDLDLYLKVSEVNHRVTDHGVRR